MTGNSNDCMPSKAYFLPLLSNPTEANIHFTHKRVVVGDVLLRWALPSQLLSIPHGMDGALSTGCKLRSFVSTSHPPYCSENCSSESPSLDQATSIMLKLVLTSYYLNFPCDRVIFLLRS